MQKEPANELLCSDGHRAETVVIAVVFPAKADFAAVDGQQAIVGYGNAMGIAADIVEDLLGSGERRLGVDDPFGGADRCEVAQEGRACSLRCCREVKNFSRPAMYAFARYLQEQPSEQARQDTNRKEEAWSAGDPAFAIGRDPTAWHDKIDVRVGTQAPQSLSPNKTSARSSTHFTPPSCHPQILPDQSG